ncbi:MAG: HypC/HybG/HupF family hydrogenase formation chaperone [Candidatus Acetothermia bacterium]|jgi:hydrogenase expression/formation protein HypC|nr:HypC/HybG/HupF family hydrogenase formation chaperone [Candidatus Acetothermia bacterium]MDH7505666.1 HypC/HybG/HupF family hydrogenase formation chaperone [Candidatus Acetothermia bacterium]
MCLAIPSRVTEVSESEALVDHGGVKKRVKLDLLDESVKVGDYLLIHTGFAIQRIPPEEAEETLRLFDELLRAAFDDEGPPLPGSS